MYNKDKTKDSNVNNGLQLEIMCPVCGNAVIVDRNQKDITCMHCGTKLKNEQANNLNTNGQIEEQKPAKRKKKNIFKELISFIVSCFENIGVTIMTIAIIFLYIELIGCIIGGLALCFVEPIIGIMVIIFGPIGAFIITCFIYGFGKLIDNSIKQEKYLESINNKIGK